ncbi:FAS1-like dehydratase domain-containing protein [Actinomadura parmotrematis]|uniref:MaoC family dehydratase N-terminal domain-containing protein n=1 Tax=Actinomadura parmotrematis TaxID=2864039 RepID=A0ABS7G0F0_9ACTN|nr:MaoC family dehydratase N-terminal domain-containing protein [Actinomadura parmotrematis]MBW8486185.1 MaoC family dehydratase N-terminal domain-containing protein [Actinomadura parmotrematis]
MIDLEGWTPAPHEAVQTLDAEPAAALAGLLDVPAPAADLPPLWQWLYFLDRPATAELGPDGHPAAGRFLPPIRDRRRMFAGGRFLVREPLRIGDTLTRRTELAGVEVKRGRTGELAFVTVRHTFLRDGDRIAVEEQDLVYRSGDPSFPTAEPSYLTPEVTAPWTLPMSADPVLLFRFSALTYNAHRIHYDQTYATQAEGHPGLVVHGPLLALLCLELPRREGHKVTELSFRARRPVYGDQPFVVAGSPEGELAVHAPGGVTAMTATFS